MTTKETSSNWNPLNNIGFLKLKCSPNHSFNFSIKIPDPVYKLHFKEETRVKMRDYT